MRLSGLKLPPRAASADDDEDFELWEENRESWEWFTKLWRRWIFNQPSGHRVRLDDLAVMAQFEIFGVKKSKRKIIMGDLLEMETAVLEVLRSEQ